MSQTCVLLLLWAGLPSMREGVMEIFKYLIHPQHHLSHSCSGYVHLLVQGPHQPAGGPGDGLVQVDGQDCSLLVTYLGLINVSTDPPEASHSLTFIYHLKKSLLTEVSIAHNHFHGTSGAKSRDYPCSYGFQLAHLCRNVSVFYMYDWATS